MRHAWPASCLLPVLCLSLVTACATPAHPASGSANAVDASYGGPLEPGTDSLSAAEESAFVTVASGVSASDAPWTERIVDPITDPYLFESPVIESSVRPIYIRHFFPKTGIFKGGRVDVEAVQLRWAVTERLAIIAVKDGHIDFQPHSGPDQSGSANIAGGLKYAIVDDREAGQLVTAGLTYENANGDTDVLQGTGDGAWRPFVSGALDGKEVDVIGSVGAWLPNDGDKNSQYIDWHLHAAFASDDLGDVRPIAEINGIHYTNDGQSVALNVEGLDYSNIGANNVKGNDWITGALGFRYRAFANTDFGVAYEWPLTSRSDIFGERFTLDAIIRF